ncbi:hypothetical protein [Tautonia rosea]|uniref:hypothetical protein n=1 Tax=Tautonia rosea TaxID=2728037 RepID=UPI00147601E1|nr:hypothetical protein [Tautonia rosea]
MATASPRQAEVSKTSFVRGYLGDHPKAGFRAVNQAWNEAGHEGSISETLVHRMRAKLGLSGNLRTNRPSKPASAAVSPPQPNAETSPLRPKKARRNRPRKTSTSPARTASEPTPTPSTTAARPSIASSKALPAASLEAEFDRLLFQVIDQGMPEVEEAIRTARRLFVLHHGR